MNTRRVGFTIVELLVVIVVLGILAGITVVSFNGIAKRARNAARTSDLVQIDKLLKVYKVFNGDYPAMVYTASPTNGYCIGSGYPNGYCQNWQSNGNHSSYSWSQSDTTITNALATIGTIPQSDRTAAGTVVGPYINVTSTSNFTLSTAIESGNAADCPAPSVVFWQNSEGTLETCTIYYSR